MQTKHAHLDCFAHANVTAWKNPPYYKTYCLQVIVGVDLGITCEHDN